MRNAARALGKLAVQPNWRKPPTQYPTKRAKRPLDGEDEAEIDAAHEARESAIEALVEADYQYSKAITIWGKLNDQVEKREHPEGLTKF